MHEVLVNRLGGLSLPRKSVVRLTDRPDMTLDVYRGRKTTKNNFNMTVYCVFSLESLHRGDYKEYTHYTIFNIKQKITLNNPKSTAMGV